MTEKGEKALRDLEVCRKFDAVDGLLEDLLTDKGIEKNPKACWMELHRIMGVKGAAWGGDTDAVTLDEMDEIEYDLCRELLVSQKWRLLTGNIDVNFQG